jgi:hypothetical protein
MAVIALLGVSAQSSGAAGSNRPQDALLFWCHIAEPMRVEMHNLCQLQRRSLERLRHGVAVAA